MERTEGYTLLETVIAMVLFVSILIPLCTTLGNFMLDGSCDRLKYALEAAESNIAILTPDHDFTSFTQKLNFNLILEREITRSGSIVGVKITISGADSTKKPLLSLSKSILDYR